MIFVPLGKEMSFLPLALRVSTGISSGDSPITSFLVQTAIPESSFRPSTLQISSAVSRVVRYA